MAVTREMLYEEVWAEPMTKVAARYGVSSSFLARVASVEASFGLGEALVSGLVNADVSTELKAAPPCLRCAGREGACFFGSKDRYLQQ